MVKLFVKIGDMAVNGHNNISRETCAILDFDLARKLSLRERLELNRSILSCECSTNFIPGRRSFRNETHWYHVNSP